MSLFNELKRRNVFRVGLAYLVSAWAIAQVADLVLDNIDAPPWVMQALLLFLGLGFIVAIIISWAYELTPEGLKKDSEVTQDESIVNHTAKKLDYITIIAAVGVLGMFVYQQVNTPQAINTDPISVQDNLNINSQDVSVTVAKKDVEKSIAVLPFADMSQEGDQEYFADGISEEILNVLVRIPKLKVAGRTSSFSYKGKNEDLRVIGKSLGVNHILEGSVRRSNTKLRITTQLIRSEDGIHIWSETYDREMADIFDIQDEIAKAVADQMVISLELGIKTSEANRTADLVVYEDYLKAKQLFLLRGRENLEHALALVNKATIRDPNYAPAWTLKSLIYGVYDSYVSEEDQRDNAKEWHALGKAAAERAVSLNPQSGESYAALGTFYVYGFDYKPAYENYEHALEMSPDNPVVLDTIAQNYLEMGYFLKAKKLSQKAISIDPLVATYRNTQGWASISSGKQEAAVDSFEKSIQLDSKLPFPYRNLQALYFNPHDIDKFRELNNRHVENGMPINRLSKMSSELANNESLLNDKPAMQKLVRESNDSLLVFMLNVYLQDEELTVNSLEKHSWSAENRIFPNVFEFALPTMYNNKRWKAQVRKDGILALWQAKGFPAHCKPIGDDDFECDTPEVKKQ